VEIGNTRGFKNQLADDEVKAVGDEQVAGIITTIAGTGAAGYSGDGRLLPKSETRNRDRILNTRRSNGTRSVLVCRNGKRNGWSLANEDTLRTLSHF
jgi:hypothetical protein